MKPCRWISLEDARELTYGQIEWWRIKGPKGQILNTRQQNPGGPSDRPVRLYRDGSMYLGGWQNGRWHGFGIQYRADGYVRIWNFDQGLFFGSGMLLWLPTAPCWIRNEWPDSVIKSKSGKGYPFIYIGSYDKGSRVDHRAVVILKDGTTRIGPWQEGYPVGEWWSDHERSITKPSDIEKLLVFQVSPVNNDCKPIPPRRSISKDIDKVFDETARSSRLGTFSSRPLPFVREDHEEVTKRRVMSDVTPSRQDFARFKATSEPLLSSKKSMKKTSTLELHSGLRNICMSNHYATSMRSTSSTYTSDSEESSKLEYASMQRKSSVDHRIVETARRVLDIAFWLATDIIGYGADVHEMTDYAQKFVEAGFDSVDLIKSACDITDVETWMKKGHLRLFQERAVRFDMATRRKQRALIQEWLTRQIIGFDADPVEMRAYAQKFIDDGFHSVQMIQDICTEDDVKGWMKTAHRRLFLARGKIKTKT